MSGSLEEFSGELEHLSESLATGKKPTLRDVLLYQRVLNYNLIIMYKNMVSIMEAVRASENRLDDLYKNQEDVFLQIQSFLDAHKLINDIDAPPPKE